MTLDSDPTVIYGITKGSGVLGRGLLRSELQDETNPYNTYRRRGLPPGPIANPGRAAMEAVANPSRTKELYFVADGSGGHVFAESLPEHNRNVARWRKIEAERVKAAEEAAKAAPAPEQTPSEEATPKPEEPEKQGNLWPNLLPEAFSRNAILVESADPLRPGLQLAQSLTPPKPAEFDGVPSFPVPPHMRKKKNAEPLEGTIAPRMADDPEASVPESERNAAAPSTDGSFPPSPAKPRPRITDASEGKKFDPLKLKGYDLNATQVIPKL